MNDSGIVSQYGFLFQRKAFVLYTLENISKKLRFIFEGKDDIEVASDEKIYSIYDPEDYCIQVKSGNVTEECFSKVICNWLLLEESSNSRFELFLENNLSFEECSAERASKILDYIIAGSSKKKSSIARMTYDKYKDQILKNRPEIEATILKILEEIKKRIYSIEDIDDNLLEIFSNDYCTDIIEYTLAMQKRLERFLYYIDKGIEESIKNKKSYSLIFTDFINIIQRVTSEISDTRYKVDIKQIKKKLKPEAKLIVETGNFREVNQLALVEDNEAFIIEGIVRELIYKDFKNIYTHHKEVDISNLEQNAKENYDSTLFALGGSLDNPKEIYIKTIEKRIESSLLPEGPIYRNGCYVYLTGDNIDDETLISWGEEHARE